MRPQNPNDDRDHDRRRAFIIAEFEDFCFVSTHYSLYRNDRIRMSDSIINHPIAVRCINTRKPIFIAGDINEQPFENDAMLRFRTAGFEVLNDTTRTNEPQVRPSRHLNERRYKDATRASGAMIDLILGYRQNPPNYEIFLRGVPYCFPKEYFMVMSDHFPYWVVVRLK